ncbi:hypothetical protein F5883DRAFT_240868 [Diaporthe sp. PMI_573]|nr:hypothetical protein F5883DRAFT_240868 [Diaporthaceae sp. PMI_573]
MWNGHSFSVHSSTCNVLFLFSVSCSRSCCGPLFPFCFPPLADAPGLGPNGRLCPQPRRWTCLDMPRWCGLVIHKYIPPPLLPTPGTLPFPAPSSSRSQRPFALHLLQRGSVLHSFLPSTEQCSNVHFLTRKTILITHGPTNHTLATESGQFQPVA